MGWGKISAPHPHKEQKTIALTEAPWRKDKIVGPNPTLSARRKVLRKVSEPF
jgi:hypothetical protein